MSKPGTLERLTEKIHADAEASAAEIIAEAKAEAEKQLAAAAQEAKKDADKVVADAKLEAVRQEEQIVDGKTLAVRDQNLGAKQEMLDKVFAEALVRLNAMEKDAFMQFLLDSLCKMDLDGDELLLPAKYEIKSIDPVNKALQKAGKKGNLTLAEPDTKMQGGFVLRKGGIEQNNTFESLVGYFRYELESEVLATLY